MSVAAAARELGCSRQAIYDMLSDGRLSEAHGKPTTASVKAALVAREGCTVPLSEAVAQSGGMLDGETIAKRYGHTHGAKVKGRWFIRPELVADLQEHDFTAEDISCDIGISAAEITRRLKRAPISRVRTHKGLRYRFADLQEIKRWVQRSERYTARELAEAVGLSVLQVLFLWRAGAEMPAPELRRFGREGRTDYAGISPRWTDPRTAEWVQLFKSDRLKAIGRRELVQALEQLTVLDGLVGWDIVRKARTLPLVGGCRVALMHALDALAAEQRKEQLIGKK